MKRWIIMGALLLGLAGAAEAQDAYRAEDATSTTAAQKISFASDAVGEMQEALAKIGKLLEQATEKGDEEQIQCVRERQASVKVLMDVSERANGAMQEALASNTKERAEQEFRKIAVALSKVRQFTAEAEACAGQGNVTAGNTDVRVDERGLTDANDETDNEDQEGLIGDDPPPTSQFE